MDTSPNLVIEDQRHHYYQLSIYVCRVTRTEVKIKMKTAPFHRQALPKYQIEHTRSSSKTLLVILIWPKDKNMTYIDCSSTAHNFHEKLSCHLLQLETHAH